MAASGRETWNLTLKPYKTNHFSHLRGSFGRP